MHNAVALDGDPHRHDEPGEHVIVEFRLPERGRDMFHPHQHHMADNGAMGWFAPV